MRVGGQGQYTHTSTVGQHCTLGTAKYLLPQRHDGCPIACHLGVIPCWRRIHKASIKHRGRDVQERIIRQLLVANQRQRMPEDVVGGVRNNRRSEQRHHTQGLKQHGLTRPSGLCIGRVRIQPVLADVEVEGRQLHRHEVVEQLHRLAPTVATSRHMA